MLGSVHIIAVLKLQQLKEKAMVQQDGNIFTPDIPIAGTLLPATRYAIELRVDKKKKFVSFSSRPDCIPKIDSITANDTNFVIAKTDLTPFPPM